MGFDRVARIYRVLERIVFGGALQRARVAQLDFSGSPRVLLLGDGDGRFLEALLEHLPRAKVDVVEASAKMIELAERRVPVGAAVDFHHQEFAEFEPQIRYDLVASHFFLDCFQAEEIRSVAEKIAGCLAEDGAWLISDFQVPEHGFLRRLRARFLLWVMYRFFRTAAGLGVGSLVDPAPVLRATGFSLVDRQVSNLGFLRADRWSS